MNRQTAPPASIIKQIIDGTIPIKSASEFRDLLKVFPDNPDLHRAFADLLQRRDAPEGASEAYRKAAELYIASGQMLQAVGAKLREWGIVRPNHHEAWLFFTVIRKNTPGPKPIQSFFTQLTFQELMAVLQNLEIVRLPAGRIIKKFGSVENYLFMVVHGEVSETPLQPIKWAGQSRSDAMNILAKADTFGEIYPFDKEKISQSFVKAMARTELIKLSKNRLIQITRKYPAVENGIKRLFAQRQAAQALPPRTTRKSLRHKMMLRLSVTLPPYQPNKTELTIEGATSDISLGGTCVILDTPLPRVPLSEVIGLEAKVSIAIPEETLMLSVTGTIAWARAITIEERQTEALGIEFRDMPPKLSGFLMLFAGAVSEMIGE